MSGGKERAGKRLKMKNYGKLEEMQCSSPFNYVK
jgi:hypothetical protein